jgi:hypothetical protein
MVSSLRFGKSVIHVYSDNMRIESIIINTDGEEIYNMNIEDGDVLFSPKNCSPVTMNYLSHEIRFFLDFYDHDSKKSVVAAISDVRMNFQTVFSTGDFRVIDECEKAISECKLPQEGHLNKACRR